MNPLRYKLMISYLPGMAAIVNSFQSPDVQKAVFDSLMEALNEKLESEAAGPDGVPASRPRVTSPAPRLHTVSNSTMSRESSRFAAVDEMAHDLAEGDSIHSLNAHQETLP